MPNSGSTCNQSLRASGLPGLWMSEMCLSKLPMACVSLVLPPKAAPLSSSLIWTWATAPCWGCALRKEASAGTPAPVNLDSWWLYPGPQGQRVRPPSLGGTRDSGSSQGKPDSAGLTGVSMKGTSWPVSTPPQSSPGTQVYSGSRKEISAQV